MLNIIRHPKVAVLFIIRQLLDEVPRNAAGKLLRRELRAAARTAPAPSATHPRP